MDTNQQNIYLIGPMGSGKTSVGMQLAKKLNMPYFDSDKEIEKATGVNVSWIFEVEGEAGFRKRERSMINTLSKKEGIVLATGGGAIVTPDNCDTLKQTGLIIYLKVSLELQLHRTSKRIGGRPLLEVDDPKQKLIELNAERAPIYEKLADYTYNTDGKTPAALANQILMDLPESW